MKRGPDEKEDSEPFAEKMSWLTAQLKVQFAQSAELEEQTKRNMTGLGMKSDEQAAIVDTMFDTEEVDSPFGKRYGSEKLVLTAEHLESLQQGKLLVVDVLGEYVLFVEMDKAARGQL